MLKPNHKEFRKRNLKASLDSKDDTANLLRLTDIQKQIIENNQRNFDADEYIQSDWGWEST